MLSARNFFVWSGRLSLSVGGLFVVVSILDILDDVGSADGVGIANLVSLCAALLMSILGTCFLGLAAFYAEREKRHTDHEREEPALLPPRDAFSRDD